MVRFDWLFFDLGNTLVDESAAQSDRYHRAVDLMCRLGTDVSVARLAAEVDRAAEILANRLYPTALRILLEDEDKCRYVLERTPYEHTLERLYPEVLAVVAGLARNFRIGVIANQSPGAADRMAAFGLGTYVAVCIASAEEKLSKPDLAIFRLALERARTTAGRSVMIGDRLDNDIRPAKELGFTTVHVLRQAGRASLEPSAEYKPDAVIRDLRELPSALATLDGSA